MGVGLSSLNFHDQDVIAVFLGDIIYERKYQEPKRLGKATSYVVEVEVVQGTYLNCRSHRERDLCNTLLAIIPSHVWEFSKARVLMLFVSLLVTPEMVSEN